MDRASAIEEITLIRRVIEESRWVSFAGVAWWLGSLLMFWVRGAETLLVFGLMMIFFQIMPGLVFYISWKKKTSGAVNE